MSLLTLSFELEGVLPSEWCFTYNGDSLWLGHNLFNYTTKHVICDRSLILKPLFGNAKIQVEAICQIGLNTNLSSNPENGNCHSCQSMPIYMTAVMHIKEIQDIIELLSNPLCLPPCKNDRILHPVVSQEVVSSTYDEQLKHERSGFDDFRMQDEQLWRSSDYEEENFSNVTNDQKESSGLAKKTDGLSNQAMKDLMSHKGQKTRNYSLDFKLEAIQSIECGESVGQVSKRLSVDRRCIGNWFKQRSEIKALKSRLGDSNFSTMKRLKGGGAPLRFKKVEEELERHIWALRSKGLQISRSQIQVKAQALTEEARMKGEIPPDSKFQASSGWLTKFLKRHNLNMKLKTTENLSKLVEVDPCVQDVTRY